MSKGLTGLNVPVITSDYKPRLDLALPAFSNWCNSLPIADTATAAKMLFFALTEINKTKMPAEKRFSLVEAIRRPLYATAIGLRKHYTNDPQGLAKKKLMIAELAQTLHTEITHAYKTIVEEITNGQDIFDTNYNRIVQVSLYRIIYFSLRRFFRSYQLYNQIEPELWSEAHLTYSFACRLKVQQIAVGTQYTVENFPVTVENCYKQILILAATNPYQWRQIEQDALMVALNYWTETTLIRPYTPNDLKSQGIYVFDPTKDLGPTHPQLSVAGISPNSLVLDLNGLVIELNLRAQKADLSRERLILLGKDGTEYTVSNACFHKLIHDWSKQVKPKDLRIPAHGALRATFGLVATYYHITGRQKFSAKKEINNELNYLQTDEEEKKPETNTVEENFPVHVCFLHDQSPGGYQIMHFSENHPIIHAGDIIGFKLISTSEQKTNPWEIGEIKWLQYHSAEKLAIGIRKLSNNPLAVAVNIIREDHSNQETLLRCILLHEQMKIITPILPFKQGQELWVRINDNSSKTILLSKQVSNSGTFKIFEYTEIKNTNPEKSEMLVEEIDLNLPKTEIFDAQKVVSEFDDIWHTL